MKNLKKAVKRLIIRYIKYNVIGVTVFLMGTLIYVIAFPSFGAWTWLLANGFGGIVDFSLITLFNRTKRGHMFDSCETHVSESKPLQTITELPPLIQVQSQPIEKVKV